MHSRHSTKACPEVPRGSGHNLRDSEKRCNLPGVTQHSSTQSRPHMELGSGVYLQGYWEGHQLPGLLAWGGPWSVASQGAVSGPQANPTVWERCLLESQVAKLPATKPYWRTERVRYGVCRTCLSSLQLGLQVTPLQGHRQLSLQHTGFATARTEPDTASSWKWLHTEPLLWGTVTSSLS